MILDTSEEYYHSRLNAILSSCAKPIAINIASFEPFCLGRFATGTHSQSLLRVLCSFVLGALRLAYSAAGCIIYWALRAIIPHPLRFITLNTIYFVEISVFLTLLVIQLIPNKLIAIDLCLLFILRNTQVSNNRNTI